MLILFAYFYPYEGKIKPREQIHCYWTDGSPRNGKKIPQTVLIGKVISISLTFSANISINIFFEIFSNFQPKVYF